ncbi:hypothetical protein CHUAL_001786 [Chamberlinius hualienensis]
MKTMGCGGSKAKKEEKEVEDKEKKIEQQVPEIDDDYIPMKTDLMKTSLQDFLDADKDIMFYHAVLILESMKVRIEQKQQMELDLKHMEEQLKIIDNRVKNLENSPAAGNVKKFLMQQDKFDELTSYEKADYLAALNEQEMTKRAIIMTEYHLKELEKEKIIFDEDIEDFREMYSDLEEILSAWFDDKYGSQLEDELEDKVDILLIELQNYEEINYKWRLAQVMVEHACIQIGTAMIKWEEIMKLPIRAMTARFQLAEEVRNNLTAAAQNIQSAHNYLPHITFPYCSPEEIMMLNKATSYVFTDMQAKTRQKHALECYSAAHRRCGALLQWFFLIINEEITKPLLNLKEEVRQVNGDLRLERCRLISKLIERKWGIKIEPTAKELLDENDGGFTYELLQDLEKKERTPGNYMNMRGTYTKLIYHLVENAPSPLLEDDLAPVPSKEVLLSNGGYIILKMNRRNRDNSDKKPNQRRSRTFLSLMYVDGYDYETKKKESVENKTEKDKKNEKKKEGPVKNENEKDNKKEKKN